MVEFQAEPKGAPDPGSIALTGPLVGRDAELQALLNLGQAVRAGLGRAVLIVGEPGMGKTRLLIEWQAADHAAAASLPLWWARGGCSSDCRDLAYYLLRRLLRSLLGVSPSADESQIRAALPALVEEMIGCAQDEAQGPEQDEGTAVCTYLEHLLLSGQEGAETRQVPPLDPQALQMQYLTAVRRLLEALAARNPLVLILENLHWADPSSVELLIRLLPLATSLPLLFCLATRPDYDAPGWRLVAAAREIMGGSLTELALSALTGPASQQLMLNLLCCDTVPQEVETLILAKAEGNPLFIEEVIRGLVDRDAMVPQEGRWMLQKGNMIIEIPDTLHGTLLARLDRLSDEAQAILRVASVVGRQFSPQVLEQVLDRPRAWLMGHLNALESAGAVSVSQVTPELTYRFRSALMQEVAYQSTSANERRRLHLAIGETMERLYRQESASPGLATTLAHHFEQAASEDRGSSAALRALEYLTLAGNTALATYANCEAESHYRRALELAGTESRRVELLSGLGEALFRQSRPQEAIQVWRTGIDLGRTMGDGDRVARLYALSARAAWYGGDADEGLRLCQEGLVAASGLPDSPGLAVLVHEAARAYLFSGQAPDEAHRLCLQALEMARRLNDTEVEAEALTTLGILPGQPPEAAVDALTRAVELAESAGLPTQARRAHNNLAAVLQETLADFRGAREHLQRAVELSRQTGNVEGEVIALSNLVGLLLLTGDLEREAALIPTLRELLGRSANPGPAATGLCISEALRWRYQGELETAIQQLEVCQVEARQQGAEEHVYLSGNSLAESWLELWALAAPGEPGRYTEEQAAQVEATLAETIEIGNHMLMTGSVWPRCLLARLRARQGRFQEARHLLAEARQKAGPRLLPFDEARLLWAEADIEATAGRWAEALVAFDAVSGSFDRLGMRWWWARALYGWAEAFISRGEPADLDRARALLREAQAAFEDVHSPRYAARLGERSQEVMAQLYRFALAHRTVAQELVVASQVQVGFLPANVPSLAGWQFAATLKPARETSGDFYDFIPLPNQKWGIVIADVTDKGMGAALYMVLGRTLIRTYAGEYHSRPEFVMRVTSRRILADTLAGMFVTAFYGVLDPSTGTLTYCNAGHNAPYLVHPARSNADRPVVEPLHRTGMALGVIRDATWEQAEAHIEPGGLLVLYTDGIVEAHDAQVEMFGQERLLRSIEAAVAARADRGLVAQEIRDDLLSTVYEFTRGAPQFDDITLMAVARDRAGEQVDA